MTTFRQAPVAQASRTGTRPRLRARRPRRARGAPREAAPRRRRGARHRRSGRRPRPKPAHGCVAPRRRRPAHARLPASMPRDGVEEPEQRQARRQHRRRDHRLPGEQEEGEGGPERPGRPPGASRDGAIRRYRSARRPGRAPTLRRSPGRPPGVHGPAGARARGGGRHAAYSIFHSDWIALRPSYSQVMPYCGRFTRWTLDFAIQAGSRGPSRRPSSAAS